MPPVRYTRSQMHDWIVANLAAWLDLSAAEIDPGRSFETYGLDSKSAVGFCGDLEDALDARFDPSLAYDYPTVEALLDHLEGLGLLRAG